ncbi:MAG: hypothetical protein RBS80_12505 [Thermoguttaceae bacterium]|jgi:hypothetical protein|nr:hypothetical protein [Thermoguttaceae bacterium]
MKVIRLTYLLVLWFLAGASHAADLAESIEAVRGVGPHGQGHVEAAAAWGRLARADAAELTTLLGAMDGANPLAANWMRTAVDAVAERAVRQGEALPLEELERFVLDRSHAARARRLAYEMLVSHDPEAEQRLIPGMVDDPSLELRRDAVAKVIEEAQAAQKDEDRQRAVAAYRRALPAARDQDQIRLVSEQLRKLGEEVELQRLMGFIAQWKLIGPFDNTDQRGFDAEYPPERELDFGATYDGKHGKVEWIEHTTTDDYGKVDLNEVIVEEKEVVAYGAAEFHSDREQTVEFRITSYNAVRLWVNGRPVIERNVYHSGSQLDQYVGEAVLQKGRNLILVKVCQNAQTQDWARHWSFQLRVCDEVGNPVYSDKPAK